MKKIKAFGLFLMLQVTATLHGYGQLNLVWNTTGGGSKTHESNYDEGQKTLPTSDGGYLVAINTNSINGDVSNTHGVDEVWMVKLSATGAVQWEKTLGGSQSEGVWAMVQASDGSFIIAGESDSHDGDVSSPYSRGNVWVVKLSAATGALQWSETFGGNQPDYATHLKATPDGGCMVLGQTRSADGDVGINYGGEDIWVLKLSSEGNMQWQKVLGSSGDDYATSITLGTDGGYLVTGVVYSEDGLVTGLQGSSDVWAVKLSATGAVQWQRCLGGPGYEERGEAVATPDGGYLIGCTTGSTGGDVTGPHGDGDLWVVKLSAAGSIQWQRSLGGSGYDDFARVVPATGGGYIVLGETYSSDGDVSGYHEGADAWVAKLSSTGTLLWQQCLGGTGEETIYGFNAGLVATPDGGCALLVGTTSEDGDVTGFHPPDSDLYGERDLWVVKLSGTGSLEWQKALGGSREENAMDLVAATGGGYIVTGITISNNGDVSGHHGDFDAWVVKLDAAGALAWQKVLGGSEAHAWNFNDGIEATPDGGAVAIGITDSYDLPGAKGKYDIVVTKYAAGGAIEWQRSYGGSEDEYLYEELNGEKSRSITATADGGYLFTAVTQSSDGDVSGQHGDWDLWVVKLSATGDIVWQRALGGSGGEYAHDPVFTADGGVILPAETSSADGDVSGQHGWSDLWVVKLSATGAIEWQKTLGGSGAETYHYALGTPDGGVLVTANTSSDDGDLSGHNGNWDIWAVKLSATGAVQWKKTYGGSDAEYNYRAWPAGDGGYILTSQTASPDGDVTGFHGVFDIWVVKINAAGELQWQKALGGSEYEDPMYLTSTTDGGYLLVGNTESSDGDVSGFHGGSTGMPGQRDAWVVKLSASGTIEWQKALGGSGDEEGFAVTEVADGGYIFIGLATSPDGDVAGHHWGDEDPWIVKLSPTGVIEWQQTLGGSNADYLGAYDFLPDGSILLTGVASSDDGHLASATPMALARTWTVKLSACTVAKPTIAASGPTTFCAGGSVVLTSSAASDNQWYKDGVLIDDATTPTYTAAETGHYTVAVTGDGCTATSDATVVNVTALPEKPVITQDGSVLTSSASTGNQWFKDGVAIAGATERQYTATENGSYTVQVTVNGCSATSDALNFAVLGIVSPGAWNYEVSAYPNPVTSRLFIRNSGSRRLQLQLIDATGKAVCSAKLAGASGIIETGRLAKGSYLLLITDLAKNESMVQTIVKQ